MQINWTDEPETPTEKVLQKEKQEILQDTQQMQQPVQEHAPEQQTQPNEIDGSTADVIAMAWNTAAVAKGYEPITDKELIELRKHTARFDAKYRDKLQYIKSPEAEFIGAHVLIYLRKVAKHINMQNRPPPQQPVQEHAPEQQNQEV